MVLLAGLSGFCSFLKGWQAALASENVRRFVGDATVRKVIVVPGRLVNIVAK